MIGFFDSGYGGLNIMSSVIKELPQYDYLYLGDNIRAPYGSYSNQKITSLSENAIEYLFSQGAKLIIIACNTITAASLSHLQQKYLNPKNPQRKILGIVRPLVEKAAEISKKNIGLIGTRFTINSQVYQKELEKLNPQLKLFSKACPLLVPFIEEAWHHSPEARMVLKKYLRSLKATNCTSLILGCTHYPFMLKDIQRFMGKHVEVINPGPILANSLIDYLQRHPEIESLISQNKTQRFLTTDCPNHFYQAAIKVMGVNKNQIQKVSF